MHFLAYRPLLLSDGWHGYEQFTKTSASDRWHLPTARDASPQKPLRLRGRRMVEKANKLLEVKPVHILHNNSALFNDQFSKKQLYTCVGVPTKRERERTHHNHTHTATTTHVHTHCYKCTLRTQRRRHLHVHTFVLAD